MDRPSDSIFYNDQEKRIEYFILYIPYPYLYYYENTQSDSVLQE